MISLVNLTAMVLIMDGGWSQKDLSNFEAMIHSMTLYDINNILFSFSEMK